MSKSRFRVVSRDSVVDQSAAPPPTPEIVKKLRRLKQLSNYLHDVLDGFAVLMRDDLPDEALKEQVLCAGLRVGDEVVETFIGPVLLPEHVKGTAFQLRDIPDLGHTRALYYNRRLTDAADIKPVAEIFGLTEAELTEAAHQYKAAKAEATARDTTTRAKDEPRLKWNTDRLPDEDPATFAWRAYAAEAKAGTLHRGVIYSEDRELHRRLNSWLRTYDMPKGIDIPTKPEWNTRQLQKVGKLLDDSATREFLRLDGVARTRRRRRAGAPPHM